MVKKSTRGGKREGAGRPIGEEGRAITIVASVPETLVAGLDERSQTEGWSRSKAVTEAIRTLLKRKNALAEKGNRTLRRMPTLRRVINSLRHQDAGRSPTMDKRRTRVMPI